MDNGKTFAVIADNYAPENKYIQSATFNGKPWNKPWFTHDQLMKGGTLQLEMGAYPNKEWGSDKEAGPPSSEDLK